MLSFIFFANDNPIVMFGTLAVILALLGFMAWYFATKSKREEASYKTAADLNGWNYQKEQELASLGSPGVIRHRFTPKDEKLNWTLVIETYLGSNSSSSSRNTIWRTDSIKLDNELFLTGARPSDFPQGLDFGDGITQMALQFLLRATLGDDAPDTSRLREDKTINNELGKYYLVFATNESLSKKILTPQIENLLIELAKTLKEKQRPAIVFSNRGLQIKCSDHISNSEALSKIVMLGNKFAETWTNKQHQ